MDVVVCEPYMCMCAYPMQALKSYELHVCMWHILCLPYVLHTCASHIG